MFRRALFINNSSLCSQLLLSTLLILQRWNLNICFYQRSINPNKTQNCKQCKNYFSTGYELGYIRNIYLRITKKKMDGQ